MRRQLAAGPEFKQALRPVPLTPAVQQVGPAAAQTAYQTHTPQSWQAQRVEQNKA
nr:hypothetical protein [Siphonobacter curvatus]